MFLYHFIWTLVLIFFAPFFLLFNRKRFAERLAFKKPINLLAEGSIWIHALSVGEVFSAIPIVDALNTRYPEKAIAFTVTTSKGMDIARSRLRHKVNILETMPVDFWWSIHRFVKKINPSLFVLVETDIWPGLINHLNRRAIKTVLVNGRISPRTYKSYIRFSFFVRKMFDGFENCLVQSNLDRQRLLRVGINPKKVYVAGNVKFDQDWKKMSQYERNDLLDLFGFNAQNLIWIAGSTHKGEEDIVIKVFNRLKEDFRKLRLIIAPRNAERGHEIMVLMEKEGIHAQLKSELPVNNENFDVIILNTVGELDRIYGIGQVSFVGGSLVPIGGHNLLEPANFGCPVIFGPFTHNFVDMSDSLISSGGGIRVKDGGELYSTLKMLLSDAKRRHHMGTIAKKFVMGNRGALKRIISSIDVYLDRSGGSH